MKITFAVFFLCLFSSFQSFGAEQLNRLMIEPYRHFSVMASYGLRSLEPLDSRTLKLEIGISCGENYSKPQSYLIVSFDDDAYSPYRLVQPVRVEARRILEAPGLPGSLLKTFYRTEVILTLPAPMKENCEYSVTAQEFDSIPLTAARDGVSCTYSSASVVSKTYSLSKESVNMRVLGLRGINPLGSGCLELSFGPAVDFERLKDVKSYKFTLNGMPVMPEVVSIRRVVESSLPFGNPYVRILRTDVFMKLASPLEDDDVLNLEVANGACSAWNRADLAFDSESVVSSSFHVDAFGYILNTPVRAAYVAKWMSALPGVWLNDRPGAGFMGGANGLPPNLPGVKAVSLSFEAEPFYTVVNQNTLAEVFRGVLKKVEKPSVLEGAESLDLPGENVYFADLSPIKKAGWYFIYIEGLGRSLPFEVRDEAFSNESQLPTKASFTDILEGKSPPPRGIVYNKPWWTNVWSYDPFTLKRLTAWRELSYNPPEYGLNFGKSPVMIGGKEWWTNVWSYNPYDLKHLTAWKHLSRLTPPPDYRNGFVPPSPSGAKPWWTNVWSYNPYKTDELTSWRSLPEFTPPSSVNSYDPSAVPWYDEYIKKYRLRLDGNLKTNKPYEYAP